MLKVLWILIILTSNNLWSQEKCGESPSEDKKLFWVELSKISFQALIPIKIPEGSLCAGFHSKKREELQQISYKSSEGSLRVFNRKYFLGVKRTVIKSDDFIESSLIKEPLPILSFLVREQKEIYSVTIEYINQLNPFEPFDSKKQKFVSFDLSLDKLKSSLFYAKFKDKVVDQVRLEIDALFNVHTIHLFQRQELITKLKTLDL